MSFPAARAGGQGGRPADRRGQPCPAPVLVKLAKRLPVVLRRRRHGPARHRRGIRGQLVGRARARHAPGQGPRQAPPVPCGRPGDRAGRQGAADGACRRCFDAHPDATLTGELHRGGSAVHSGETAAKQLLADVEAGLGDSAGRDSVRQRPDGHRRAADAHRARHPGPRGRSGSRLRRHLSHRPYRDRAHHRAPADARGRRARLRAAHRTNHQPDAAADGRGAANRACHQIQLRLPAGHAHAPAGQAIADRRSVPAACTTKTKYPQDPNRER